MGCFLSRPEHAEVDGDVAIAADTLWEQNLTNAKMHDISESGNSENMDMFKTYAEMAEQETNRRATQVDPLTDIFSRKDILSLPSVEGSVYGQINNEESGEYIIAYWSRILTEPVVIPSDIMGLIARYIDITYRSQWSSIAKGPNFQIDLLNKCKASIPRKYNVMKQMIRTKHCCPRGKESVFCIKRTSLSGDFVFKDNFIGIVSEFENSFNISNPRTGYGFQIRDIRCERVTAVVDLREGQYRISFPGSSTHSRRLPSIIHDTPVEEVRWYPFVAGDFSNMECTIEFD